MHVATGAPPGRGSKPRAPGITVPEELKRRLASWIDLEQLGVDGLWLWLRDILPLLPGRDASSRRRSMGNPGAPNLVRELHRRLVDHSRDRSRLAVILEQYARDNQTLARRLAALEAALRDVERDADRSGDPHPLSRDVGPVPARKPAGRDAMAGTGTGSRTVRPTGPMSRRRVDPSVRGQTAMRWPYSDVRAERAFGSWVFPVQLEAPSGLRSGPA